MKKWKVKFLPEALKDLQDIDNSMRKRILSVIPKLENDPLDYGEPLGKRYGLNLTTFYKTTPLDGYRIIYYVQKNEILVIIIALGKREKENIYKNAAKRIEKFREMTNVELKKIDTLLEK